MGVGRAAQQEQQQQQQEQQQEQQRQRRWRRHGSSSSEARGWGGRRLTTLHCAGGPVAFPSGSPPGQGLPPAVSACRPCHNASLNVVLVDLRACLKMRCDPPAARATNSRCARCSFSYWD